jgi:hypothetical protein
MVHKKLFKAAKNYTKNTCPYCGRKFANDNLVDEHVDLIHPLEVARDFGGVEL